MLCPFFSEVQLNVCCEDTFYRIQERYSMFNSDAASYTWRLSKYPINMSQTWMKTEYQMKETNSQTWAYPEAITYQAFLYYNDP
ncbi:hypothetical protein NQ317_017549 [Molorchus minor]|uniref:Uncharacterized protein n=1 Tax=Molorchus minor TaxID=1323400 RepID=A0ABQ9JBU8_9CUCU|nr:hypothetical protein NQ317_017549 [Molorchus minor]